MQHDERYSAHYIYKTTKVRLTVDSHTRLERGGLTVYLREAALAGVCGQSSLLVLPDTMQSSMQLN
jgi:hypothetical protein